MNHRQETVDLPRLAVNVWPDFGNMVGVSRTTAYAIVTSGRIRVVRVGARILIPMSAIEEFLSAEAELQTAA